MRKQILVALGLAVLTGRSLAGEEPAKPDASQMMAWLQFVAAEVRELRRELTEDRLERQEIRVRALQRELGQVRLEHQDSEDVDRSRNQELVQVDQRLGDPAITPEERSQLEELRTSVTAQRQTERTAVTQKEAQFGEQLRREQARLESLRALARSLAPASAESQH